jgi:phage repressor protein C with HTH and peptisase S24 domain
MTLGQRIAHFRNKAGLTQEQLAAACGWESKSRIGNYERDTREPSLEDLRAIASALGITLFDLVSDDVPTTGPSAVSDHALIPQYTAKGSAGNGHSNEHVEVRGGLMFKRDWLRRMGLKDPNLRVIYTTGSSMYPTLCDGDAVLLDLSQTAPADGRIYALLTPEGELIIKRLVRTIAGTWLIRSDNEDKRLYPDQVASDTEVGHLLILGRIVWHGGAV